MSRTFELLQRTGKTQTLFVDAPTIEVPSSPPERKWDDAPASNPSVRRLNLDIEGLGRE